MSYNNAVDIRTLMLDLDSKRTNKQKVLHPTTRERATEATQQVIEAYASALKGEFPSEASLDENGWFNTYTTLNRVSDPVIWHTYCFWHTYYMLQDKGFRTKIVDKGSVYGEVILIRV